MCTSFIFYFFQYLGLQLCRLNIEVNVVQRSSGGGKVAARLAAWRQRGHQHAYGVLRRGTEPLAWELVQDVRFRECGDAQLSTQSCKVRTRHLMQMYVRM